MLRALCLAFSAFDAVSGFTASVDLTAVRPPHRIRHSKPEVEKEQTTVSKEEKAILKEGSIIGIIEIPGIDIRYPVMEETGSEMLNAGTGNNAFYCQVQI